VVLEHAAEHHLAAHALAFDRQRLEFQVAIVEQDAVARLHIARDGAVLRGDQPRPALVDARIDDHFLTRNQLERPFGKLAAADLGSAQVGEDADMAVELVRHGAHVGIHPRGALRGCRATC
jgi:hypothetical protein